LITLLTLIAIIIVVRLYIRCLAAVVYADRRSYRISDWFALCIVIAIVAAMGCVWDVLTVGLLLLYSILSGPLWKRLVRRWTTGDRALTIWTSAAIVGSFIVGLTVVCILVVVLAPAPFVYCANLDWALYSSFIISFSFIWGDNYDSDAQLLLYGLPFGLPLNLAVGLLAGAVLGRLASLMCTSKSIEQ
jgi:hypothetical protein